MCGYLKSPPSLVEVSGNRWGQGRLDSSIKISRTGFYLDHSVRNSYPSMGHVCLLEPGIGSGEGAS